MNHDFDPAQSRNTFMRKAAPIGVIMGLLGGCCGFIYVTQEKGGSPTPMRPIVGLAGGGETILPPQTTETAPPAMTSIPEATPTSFSGVGCWDVSHLIYLKPGEYTPYTTQPPKTWVQCIGDGVFRITEVDMNGIVHEYTWQSHLWSTPTAAPVSPLD